MFKLHITGDVNPVTDAVVDALWVKLPMTRITRGLPLNNQYAAVVNITTKQIANTTSVIIIISNQRYVFTYTFITMELSNVLNELGIIEEIKKLTLERSVLYGGVRRSELVAVGSF